MTFRSPSAADRLVTAGLAEFASHGPAGARTDRIAARAGVNKQLIHYYFRSKAGLYQAVIGHTAHAVVDQLGRLPLVGLTAVERLRRLVRGQFDFLLQHPQHAAVLVRADSGGEWADLAVRPIHELLTEGQATGFFRDDVDPLELARMALALNLSYFALTGISSRWGDAAAWRDRAAELVVRGATW